MAIGEFKSANYFTGTQIHAARVLLNWKRSDLADAAGVSVGAVGKLERGAGVHYLVFAQVEVALHRKGVELISEDGKHGVCLHQSQKTADIIEVDPERKQ